MPDYAWLLSTLWRANIRNNTPPATATVRCEMRIARSCPPTTAVPVHSMCPMTAPIVTPTGLYTAARDTVAICDRSPHSAAKQHCLGQGRQAVWLTPLHGRRAAQ